MSPWKIIQELESDNSRLFKESVVADHIDNADFTWGLRQALDPLITFGVKDVPEKKDPTGEGFTHDEFDALIHKLHQRELTGHAARDAILIAMAKSTQEQWNDWYRRILIKDLRCGVSEKTVNKVRKGTVPVFGCMLAHDGAKHEKKIAGQCFINTSMMVCVLLLLCKMAAQHYIAVTGNYFPTSHILKRTLARQSSKVLFSMEK